MKKLSTLFYRLSKGLLCMSMVVTSTKAGFAQAPAIQWQKSYGGSGSDVVNCVRQTSDGGFIYGGSTNSIDGDITHNLGNADCWVVKTDSNGVIQWQHSYGGSDFDQIDQIKPDINKGYIFAAYTASIDSESTGNHGGGDGWIVKLDDTGGIVWQQVMGSSGFDFFNGVCNTADSGYLVVGSAGANDGDISGYQGGGGDVWVVKFTSAGSIAWNKVYGGPGYEIGFDVLSARANESYVVGLASQNGGAVTGYHGGIEDAWILSLDDTGGIKWAKTFGGTSDDKAVNISQSPSGNFILSGYSNSTGGDVTNNHGGYDYWAFGMDTSGSMLWSNCYGGPSTDISYAAAPTFDGGAILSGFSLSTAGEVTGNHGHADYWAVKINDTGAIMWENSYGGSLGDTSNSIIQTSDSGYVIAGVSPSTNGDVTGNHGEEDMWIVKLDKAVAASISVIKANSDLKVFPTLTGGIVHIEMPKGYENATVQLTGITGNTFYLPATSGLNRCVDISTLPAGMYLLTVLNNGEVSTFKVVLKQ